jgi:hypothetical protein
MTKNTKIFIITAAAVLILVIAYFIYKNRAKKPLIGTVVKQPGTDVTGSRTAVRSAETILTTNGTDRWIVKGDKPQGKHCPMGQSEIWDGTKWVCAVRSGDFS